MLDNISVVIGIAVGFLSLGSFCAYLVNYIGKSATKSYAAQQEMKEIREELLQLKAAIDNSTRTTEFQFQTLTMKLTGLDNRMDSVTVYKTGRYEGEQ